VPVQKLNRILLFICLTLGTLLFSIYRKGKSEPVLTLKYLTETNRAGDRIAQFAVTNVGSGPAIAFNSDQFEILVNGVETGQMVSCSRGLHRLGPGQGDVLEVSIPLYHVGFWRLHCRYANEGIKSRYCDLQSKGWRWVSRLDSFIPSRLKEVPRDVHATSEWIYESQPFMTIQRIQMTNFVIRHIPR
jgi:hypothetical protein